MKSAKGVLAASIFCGKISGFAEQFIVNHNCSHCGLILVSPPLSSLQGFPMYFISAGLGKGKLIWDTGPSSFPEERLILVGECPAATVRVTGERTLSISPGCELCKTLGFQ